MTDDSFVLIVQRAALAYCVLCIGISLACLVWLLARSWAWAVECVCLSFDTVVVVVEYLLLRPHFKRLLRHRAEERRAIRELTDAGDVVIYARNTRPYR